MVRTECHRAATVGINSDAYIRRFVMPVSADRVLISLGSNDSAEIHTETSLMTLRARISAAEVTWLLSANKPRAHAAALNVARSFGDKVIEVRTHVSNDGVHPTGLGYRRIADMWKSP